MNKTAQISPKIIAVVSALVTLLLLTVIGILTSGRLGDGLSTTQTGLTIKEWNKTLQINQPDAYYELKPDGTAYVSTRTLDELAQSVSGCRSGLSGITINRQLEVIPMVELMCVVSALSTTLHRIDAIQVDIKSSLK